MLSVLYVWVHDRLHKSGPVHTRASLRVTHVVKGRAPTHIALEHTFMSIYHQFLKKAAMTHALLLGA